MQHIALVAGARPNFMKIAPLAEALHRRGVRHFLVHTGQHYDLEMSQVFFDDLGIRPPAVNLGVGAGERISRTRRILTLLIPLLGEQAPDLVVVVGDTDSTAAGAIAGVTAGIPVAHVEAGLRSFNWRMPEELNRMIADHHADLLFATEGSGIENLRREAIPMSRVHHVGNVMIDTLLRMQEAAARSDVHSRLGLAPGGYGVVTLHRPENVDDPATLKVLADALVEAGSRLSLVFPVHPRTRERLAALGIGPTPSFRFLDPLGYIDMLALVRGAATVLTDSGGLQEETTALGVPCMTLRTETERPITVEQGTNEVVGTDRDAILGAVDRLLAGRWKRGTVPALWDGRAAERIADIIIAA